MRLRQLNDETSAAWGNAVKWVGQQANEYIPNELDESGMVRKYIENRNYRLADWAAEKKTYQISKEKRAQRNAAPSALDELAYPDNMTDAIEQANTHLQAKSKINPAIDPTRASSFAAALNEEGSFANPKGAKEKGRRLHEFSHGCGPHATQAGI